MSDHMFLRDEPELMEAAAAERQRDPGKSKSARQEPKTAVPASEDDASDESDSDGDEKSGRQRKEIDFKALGFLRARIHLLEDALAIEQQLRQLGLLDGSTADLSPTQPRRVKPEPDANLASPTSSLPSSPIMGGPVSSGRPMDASSPMMEAPDSNDSSFEDDNGNDVHRQDDHTQYSVAGTHQPVMVCLVK